MGQGVLRYDRARLGRVSQTPTGGVRAPAHVARTGVQTYRLPGGGVRREYRPPEEVFHPDSLASYRGAAVTVGHPRRVDRASWARDAVGVISHVPGRAQLDDGYEYVATEIDVNRDDAVRGVEAGELVELSAGYTCDYDPTPGVAPNGEHYDGVQRNIRINHVALLGVGKARAGRRARILTDADELRLDSDGNQVVGESGGETARMKFVINGKEFEAGPELQAEIARLEVDRKAQQDRADAAEGKAAAETARADKAEKERADAVAATSPEAIGKLVADELAFRASVLPVLGADFKFDGQSRKAIKLAVIEKVDGVTLDADAADAYVDGYFNSALARAPKVDAKGGSKSEDYSAKSTTKADEGDKLYLDNAAWEAHLHSFHGKQIHDGRLVTSK